MEIENAVSQAKKELANRFDFEGSDAEITLEMKANKTEPSLRRKEKDGPGGSSRIGRKGF
jgi:hypothetical protein